MSHRYEQRITFLVKQNIQILNKTLVVFRDTNNLDRDGGAPWSCGLIGHALISLLTAPRDRRSNPR